MVVNHNSTGNGHQTHHSILCAYAMPASVHVQTITIIMEDNQDENKEFLDALETCKFHVAYLSTSF